MNKVLIIVAALGSMFVSSAAYASNNNHSGYDYGTIRKINRNSETVTLANGNTYDHVFAKDLKGLKVGQKVGVWYYGSQEMSISRA